MEWGGGDNEESVRFLNVPIITDIDELSTIINSGTVNPSLEMSKIIDTWYRFVHYNKAAVQYMDYTNNNDIPQGQNLTTHDWYTNYLNKDKNGWEYISSTNTIRDNYDYCTYAALLSDLNLSSYYLRVFVNTHDDDDHFCFVIGYMKDSQGVEHTLTYIRAAGAYNTSNKKDTYYGYDKYVDSRVWCALVYDFCNATQTIIADKSKDTGIAPYYQNEGEFRIQLSIERVGNSFEFKSTQFSKTMQANTPFNPVDKYTLNWSLPNIKPANWGQTMYDNIVTMLKNNSFGVGIRSNRAEFTIIEQKGIFNSNDTIYDINSGKYYRYNYSNKQFEEAGIIDTSMIPNNCFLYSTINGNREFYYYRQGSYIEIDNI